MACPQPIDLLSSPIRPGTNLIEASAGTGKTQTIAGLFLRLLLETEVDGAPIQVDQILVLTFTEAATEELRDRIRGMLVRALRAFELNTMAAPALALAPTPSLTPSPGSAPTQDPYLAGLIQRHGSRREKILERLRLSLNCFDLAPIFTIHGFCQRALKDRAFESGSLFDEELLPDQSVLMHEIADDFWRRQFYEASPLLMAIAARHALSAPRLLPLLKSGLSHPRLRLLSRAQDAPDLLAARIAQTFAQARQLWRTDHAALRACFGSRRRWGNNPYNDDAKMAPLFASLDRLFVADDILPRDFAALERFTNTAITAGITKLKRKETDQAPEHPFFGLCESVVRDAADFVVALQKSFFETGRAALVSRKRQQKLLSYDDLLTRLADALHSPGGNELSAELRRRYKAALIDEFQDTDPVQAGIFDQIFLPPGNRSAAPNSDGHRLFLIGDPKQAIYGFRGADIFSYLAVAEKAEHQFTLGENWRSDSGLVRAVNTFFGQAAQAFVFPKIGFEKVRPRGQADAEPLRLDGERQPPFQLWFCPRDPGAGEMQKNQAREILPKAVAGEIARLLAGPNRIGTRPLRPQDFAVLVMTHREAQWIQDTLAQLDIPSVQQTQESVFASDEAIELLRVLTAITEPSFEPVVRGALATRLSGIPGEELHRLQADDSAWQRHLDRYRGYFEEWNLHGFAAMFRHWSADTQLRSRLVAAPRGERALTNTLHLAELLHQTAAAEKLGPAALVKWFGARVGSEEAAAEEHQLRLERDENAVQIVTVHKCKGLQYEIVFVPFCWRESERPRSARSGEDPEILFHDWQTGELTRDLGPDVAEAHQRQANAERLAENVRLLYVALTRARHRCYLAWGAFKGAGSSAPAWLLHRPRGVTTPPAAPGAAAWWNLELKETSDAELRADLEALARASADADAATAPVIAIHDIPREAGPRYHPADDAAPTLATRPFSGAIADDWRIASFSWMASGQRSEAPDHDVDELQATLKPTSEAGGIFAFPRGSKAGSCLHKIFETVELSETDPARIEHQVRRQLSMHGIDEAHAVSVATAVRHTLAAPLRQTADAAAGDSASEFRLNQIGKASRLVELEFCFALRPVDPGALRRAFAAMNLPVWAEPWPERIGQLVFRPTQGYLKGFIDLVCERDGRYHLVDWKSNWLGNTLADYDDVAIQREMISRFYVLQYHLYAVALHRHLQLRLPNYQFDRHFGGVHYLFVRGIDPRMPGRGIFSDYPTAATIERLAQTLLNTTS